MVSFVKRVPPPPNIANMDPMLNRWLHDLTEFLSEGGALPAGSIPGYDVLLSTVATHSSKIAGHTIDIALLTSQMAVNTSAIAAHATLIADNASDIADVAANVADNTDVIAMLVARSEVLTGIVVPDVSLGVDGDWYTDTVALHIYVKTAGSWLLIV